MQRGGKTGGRGRPRLEVNDDYLPHLFKTPGRKKGRPRKTPPKMVNESDDDHTPAPHKIPKRRGRENQTENQGEYFVSDLVWVKVEGFPWWPGQILEPSSAPDNVIKNLKKDSNLIGYFGYYIPELIDTSNIRPFGLHFLEMEKQSGEETFKICLDAALDDVSRRVECGLACRCLPERVLDSVKGQGIQVQCSRIYYDGDSFPAAASFVPAELVAHLKSLAETTKAAVSRLQFTSVRAQLLAFRRWKGCSEFPPIEKFTTSLENDADPMALHEEEFFDEVPEVLPAFKKDDADTVKGNSFTKRKHPAAEGQRKKKHCMLESMPAIGSCFSEGENNFQELASSLKKKGNANGEVSVEKVSGPLKSDSLKLECGSSMIRSKRSEDKQLPVPMDLSEDHVAQTQATVSFNLTEAAMDEDDKDGIESSIDPALVDVKGYHVRSEIATILHQILEQHGDIAKDCNAKALRECFLEKVCCFYDRLQRSSFQAIKRDELFDMAESLDKLERMGLNVKWLSERVDAIFEGKVFLKVFARKKKQFKEVNDHLATLRNTMALIERRHSVLDEEIKNMKAEVGKIQEVRNWLNRPLVDGLI